MAKKKLKTYAIYGTVQGSKYIGEVEATSKEEAEKLAWDHDNCSVSMCWQCSSDCEDAEITEIIVEESN